MARKRSAAHKPDPEPEAHAGLLVETVPLASLTPDPDNARTHPGRNLEAIVGSLRRFGQRKPIVVDADGIVRAGNGTLEAARSLGWETIAVVRTALRGPEAAAYALADNRSSDLGAWDDDRLAEQLRAIDASGLSFDGLGWDDDELGAMLDADEPAGPEEPAPAADGSELPYGDRAEAWTLSVTPNQRAVIAQAIAAVRDRESDPTMADGRALELICADYVAGA